MRKIKIPRRIAAGMNDAFMAGATHIAGYQ